MKEPARWILGGLGGFALALILCLVCWREPEEDDDVTGGEEVTADPMISQKECPFHEQGFLIETDQGSATYDTLPLVGNISGVPEYHDCQRFIDGTGRAYGPLVGIYAARTLAGFVEEPADPAPGVDLRDLGAREDPDRAREPAPERPRHPAGLAIGVIVDFDKTSYDPLGIRPGVNCLFVYPERGTPHGYGAKVVPVGSQGGRCTSPATREAPGTELLVFTRRMPLDHPSDYPAVARWDWDETSSVQYIGISCFRHWCEIGPKAGFTRSATHLFPIPDGRERRVFAVKGWHDEQWLAHPSGNSLRPMPFKGALVPVRNLADLTLAGDFRSNRWADVARVSIGPHSPTYESKFHFTTAAMPGSMNRIALCNGSWTECLAKDPPSTPAPVQPNCAATDGGFWWAKITNTLGERHYYCVNRKDHAGITMPGTARWRWLSNDETIWIDCDQGCCQVQSGGTFY